MVDITIISGDAGTGKSYELAKHIYNTYKNNLTFVVLAYTHSAVNTIYNTFFKLYNIDIGNKFMTIHKYFKINIITNKIQHNVFEKLDYMFIDEYSLISVELFNNIFGAINSNVNNLVLCGDYKQLHSIKISNNIEYDKLLKYMKQLDNKYTFDEDLVSSIQHFDNSIISLPSIQKRLVNNIILTEQKRSNNEITSLVNNYVFNDNPISDDLFVSKASCVNLINNNGYIFIASKYKILQDIHNCITNYVTKPLYEISQPYGLNKMKLYDDQLVTITTNTKEFCNGDTYIFKEYNKKQQYILLQDINTNENKFLYKINYSEDEHIEQLEYFPILPYYLTTFHKSQGKTFNNVIVCVDNLFDFTMLYTGITRAKDNVLFYTNSEYKPKYTNKCYNILNDLANSINQ